MRLCGDRAQRHYQRPMLVVLRFRLPEGMFNILSFFKPLLNQNNLDLLLHLFSFLVTQNQTEETKMNHLPFKTYDSLKRIGPS